MVMGVETGVFEPHEEVHSAFAAARSILSFSSGCCGQPRHSLYNMCGSSA